MKIQNISEKHILKDISFFIKGGEKVALIGPNGAGKTTLLNIVSGISEPTKGKIIGNYRKAIVFQNNRLDEGLTIKQNLSMRMTKKEYNNAEKKLKRYGITNCSLKYRELSGGQKRIVNLIRVVTRPIELLILDELSAGIDVNMREKIWKILETNCIKKNISILYTTHVLEELNYADKILYLKKGEIVYYGSSEEFRKKLPTYKLTVGDKVNKYFLTSKDALTYLEKHPKLLNSLFEIKKVNYKDIFTYLGRGKNA